MLDKCAAVAALSPAARRLHLAILTEFIHTGRPPDRLAPDPALAELARRDVIALDARGRIRAAYPFSPVPTPHRVTWPGGPAAHAMCAIDALGMSAMLGRPVTIASAEPGTSSPVTVDVDGDTATWSPATAVVFAADTGEDCCASVDRTCGHINFFTTAEAARAWATRHPDLPGELLEQPRALALGIAEFGTLLAEPAD